MAEKILYPYIITLRHQHSRAINIIGFLLSFASLIFFLREMVLRGKIVLPYLAGVVFIAAMLIWNIYLTAKTDREVYYSKSLLIAGLVWTKMPFFEWLVFVFILLAVLEYQAKLAPEIGFSNDHITFNRLFRKKYPWSAIDNVILKDGILTVDFKDNKIFQKEIDSGENEASEQEFNGWVKQFLPGNK